MSDIEFDYEYLTRRALKRVVQDVLSVTAELKKTPGEHHYLINFQGGDHMIFSGRPRGLRDILGDPSKDAAFQSLILQATTAFWDAWLKDSAESRVWLTAESGGLKERLGDEADYRWK